MEKSEPPTFYVVPLAAETNQPQYGCQSPQGENPEMGWKSSDGPPPQGLGYRVDMPPPPPTYQSQFQNPPPPGYQPQPPQQGYPPQPEYQPQPPQQGYPPQPEYHPQPGYPPQFGYPSQPGAAEPPYLQKKFTLREDARRNKPQSNSLSAATLIFTSGGMSFAQSTGIGFILHYDNQGSYIHMQICWFVAVVIGAIISTALIQTLTKRLFNFLSAILVIVSGILFVASSDSVVAIAIARYCNGIAFGLTLIPAIVAGSEQSAKRFRGSVLSVEQMGIASGIMLQVIYTNFWEQTWDVDLNQMHGILSIFQGTLAFLLTYFLTLESALFYLRKGNETEAIDVLRRSQRPREVTNETYALLYENKRLLEEDIARGHAVNVSTGVVPIIKICLFRAFVSMSFSLPVTWAFLLASAFNDSSWGPYSYSVMRFIGVLIGLCTIDHVGRKLLSSFSLIVGGGLLIAVGAIFSSFAWDPINSGSFDAIVGLLLTFQVLAGIAAPSSTCYLGEAFSISVKPFFILVAVIVENVVQIIICCSFGKTLQSVGDYGYAVGVLQAVFGIVLFLTMPETKQITLREALAMFKKILHIGRPQNDC